MHQTRKGNQWRFGCKAHIGADLHRGVVHALKVTAANQRTRDMTRPGFGNGSAFPEGVIRE